MFVSRLRKMAIGGLTTTDRSAHDYANFKRQYKLGAELGRGGFGTVYCGFRISDNLNVACKYVMRSNVTEWACLDGRMVPLEIVLLMRCQGIPGVIQTIDWFERPDGYMIVMERPSPSTDLFDYISVRGALTEDVARDYFRQVVDTVLACYHVSVIHRDIKDENLVVDMKNGLVKLIDFGSGAFHKEGPYTDFEGTRVYSPPEWIEESCYDGLEAAVWSLGILLFDMVCGDIPFRKDSEICNGTIQWRNHLSQECKNLIQQCLAREGCDRPSLEAILEHPWMQVSSSNFKTTKSELNADRHKLASVPDRLVAEAHLHSHPRVPLTVTRSDQFILTPSTSSSTSTCSAAIFDGATLERVPHPEVHLFTVNPRILTGAPIGSPCRRHLFQARQLATVTSLANPPTQSIPSALTSCNVDEASHGQTSQCERKDSIASMCTVSSHSSGSSGYGTTTPSPPMNDNCLLTTY
ncbi:kinase domain protein [Dictyocaulus viviparus]|uniref:Serine/threonine-protein kinase 1 n=1 Tax=Dictyocaulus viviparus TaxID=29172 RepID=A0A0D8YDN3_DICVI|nr:kinase domain protein [Dictyocaulus viviparus]